jgi:hypothetical protein
MTKHEESFLNMLVEVITLLENYPEILAENPAIKEVLDVLIELRNGIIAKGGTLKEDTKGNTAAKHNVLDQLSFEALVLAGAIYSYAVRTKDTALATSFDYGERHFTHERIDEIPLEAKNILDKAIELGNKLEPYGIHAIDVENLTNSLAEVDVKSKIKIEGTQEKGSARSLLFEDFKKVDKEIELLEKLTIRYKKSNPEFHAKLSIAKTVKSKATGSRKKGADAGTDKTENKGTQSPS